MDVVSSPDVRDTVSESLARDLGRYQKRMKLNESKTKTMIVSRSRTMYYQSPPFTIGGNFLKESDDIVTLGVTFDSNIAFEKHHGRFPEQLLKGLDLEEVMASLP